MCSVLPVALYLAGPANVERELLKPPSSTKWSQVSSRFLAGSIDVPVQLSQGKKIRTPTALIGPASIGAN